MTSPSQPLAPLQLLMTYRMAAKALAISERSLARLVADSKIPVVRIGASVRFSPGALQSYVAAAMSEGVAE